MRIVDADALPISFDGHIVSVWKKDLDNAPTIDPEDLRPKGEWIRPTKINGRSFNIPHCSNCEEVPCGIDEHTRYCPNCGAKMEVNNG